MIPENAPRIEDVQFYIDGWVTPTHVRKGGKWVSVKPTKREDKDA